MFDVLTYEKGGAVLRMLEQYLGEDRFRDGIRLLPRATTPTATPSRPTCGTPSRRRRASPCAGSWTRWIFQGGHPMVEVDLAGRRRRAAAPGAVPAVARPSIPKAPRPTPTASATCGRCRSCCGRRSAATVREQRVLLDGPRARRRPRRRRRLGARQRRRLRLLPGALHGGAARARSSHAGIGRLEVLERYGLLDDAMAAGRRRVDDRRRAARPRPRLRRRDRRRRCGGGCATRSLELDRVVDDDGRDAFHATVRALAGAGAAPRRVRTRRRRGRPRPASCAACCSYVAAVSAPTPRPIAEARRVRGRRHRRARRRSTRRCSRRPRRSWPRPAAPRTSRPASTGSGRRRRRRRRCASSTTSPASTTPSSSTGSASWPQRGPHARTRRTCCASPSQNRTEGARVWSFMRPQLGGDQRALPVELDRADARGHHRPRRRGRRRRRAGVLRRARGAPGRQAAHPAPRAPAGDRRPASAARARPWPPR